MRKFLLATLGSCNILSIAEALTNMLGGYVQDISHISLSANWMSASGHSGEDAKLFEAVKAVGMDLCPELGLTVPVGKDSMSMKSAWQEEGKNKSVTAPLSLVITAFSKTNENDNKTDNLWQCKATNSQILTARGYKIACYVIPLQMKIIFFKIANKNL
jgi:phosphoribosylformylglycinamidine (FGAM) synthase-like enzyme